MKRLLQGTGALVLVIPALGVFGASASANAPGQQGWWWQGNPGGVPQAGINPSAPPPDVPTNGLLVEGGSGSATGASDSNPTAFAAVVYQLAQGDTATTLTLNVTSGSATTPSVTLELCPLANPALKAEQGGPMSDAPTFNCSTNATSQASSSGGSFKFDISKFASTEDLAVAILPTSPTDRVVFDQPTASSLAVQPGFSASSGSSTQPSVSAAAPSGASSAPSAASTALPGASTSPAAVPPAIAATPSRSSSTQSGSNSGPSISGSTDSFTPASSRTDRAKPVAVALILVVFAVGATSWLAAGRAAVRATLWKEQPA